MTPNEIEDSETRKNLQKIANMVDKELPFDWGFILLAFPFGQDGRMNYVSNGKREDVVRAMYEFIARTKQQFGEHVGEAGSGEQDEQIARALQRVSELEGMLQICKMGSCTCITKTPDPKYHSESCRYRKICELLDKSAV